MGRWEPEGAEDEAAAQRGLQVAVRDVQPVEVGCVVWVGGREGEAPGAVDVDDVVGDGAGFGELCRVVLSERGGWRN